LGAAPNAGAGVVVFMEEKAAKEFVAAGVAAPPRYKTNFRV